MILPLPCRLQRSKHPDRSLLPDLYLLHLHSLVLSHLSSQYTPLMEHLNSQTSQLLNIQADLSSGEPAIKDEMARLEAVRDVCVSVVDKVGGVVVAAEERVRDLERRGEVGVDEVVCSISIVHNQ
jgi:ESCRT-I complex subunit TSG101